MRQICIDAEEVANTSNIGIHSRINIQSVAKLDEISVRGKCVCEDKPWPLIDLIILIDGSDSYNNKVTIGGKTEEGDAFEETQAWTAHLTEMVANSNLAGRTSMTVIQFSGVKQLEKNYVPGSAGSAGAAGLSHYQIQYGPSAINDETDLESCKETLTNYDGLDGNGQLFLCLQDITLDNFVSSVDAVSTPIKDQDRRRVVVIVSDEEWDVKKLANAYEGEGVHSDGDQVCGKVNELYTPMAVIVRPNEFADQNEEFIVNTLCGGKKHNYHKVYTSKFGKGMKRAANTIIENVKDYR